MTDKTTPLRPGSPCVAVVMPAYNAEQTIAAALRSALAEPEVAELVVVDDGSSDATGQAAQACDDKTGRLRVIRQPNRGPAAACNAGVAMTQAPVWCILDADDAFAPRRLGTLLGRLGHGWDIAADTLAFRFSDGREHRLDPAGAKTVTLEDFVRGNIPLRKSPRCELGYLQPLMRREFFERRGLTLDTSARFAEDYMFCAGALAQGARFRWTSGPGYIAHVSSGSLSHIQTADDYERVIAFDQALMDGCTRSEARALRRHMRVMRLKAQYLRVEAELSRGRRRSALALALRDPATAGFMFNHRCRPLLSRLVKGTLGLDVELELLSQFRRDVAAERRTTN